MKKSIIFLLIIMMSSIFALPLISAETLGAGTGNQARQNTGISNNANAGAVPVELSNVEVSDSAIEACIQRVKSNSPVASREKALKYCQDTLRRKAVVAAKETDLKRENIATKYSTLNTEQIEKIRELDYSKIRKLSQLTNEEKVRVSNVKAEVLEKISELPIARVRKLTENTQDLSISANKIQIKKVPFGQVIKARTLAANDYKVAKEKYVKSKEMFQTAKEDYTLAKENFNKYKNMEKECLESTSQECEDARQKSKEYAIEYLKGLTDSLIKQLEQIKYQSESSETISTDDSNEIITDIDKRISILEELRTELDSSDLTKDDIKEYASKIKEAWAKHLHQIKIHQTYIIYSKVEQIMKKSQLFEQKLNDLLEYVEANELELDIEESIVKFSEANENARVKLKEAKEYFSTAQSLKDDVTADTDNNEEIITALKEADKSMREANDYLKEAHNAFTEILRKVRELNDEDIVGILKPSDDDEFLEITEENVGLAVIETDDNDEGEEE